MQPQETWLAMIPIFTFYWNFRIAERLDNYLTKEFIDRGIAEEENPGRSACNSYALLFALGYLPISSSFMLIMGLFSFAFYIRYWLKVSNFKALLIEHNRFIEEQSNQHHHEA